MLRFKLFLLFLLGAVALNAAKIGTLQNIYEPLSMEIRNGSLFVTDQQSVFIFDLESIKFQKKLGRKGKGPSEFTATPMVKAYPGEIFVYNTLKFARFKTTGELISEKRTTYFLQDISPIGDKYVIKRAAQGILSPSQKKIYVIGLFDKELEELKILASHDITFKRESNKKVFPLVRPLFKFRVYDNHIFVVDAEKGFRIDVYNISGDLAWSIEKEYKRIKISKEDKSKILEEYKSIPGVKKRWPIIRKFFVHRFPEYYFELKDFTVTQGKIFVKTYLQKNGKEEFWVLSLKGDLLKKIFLPATQERFWTIYKGSFYYIRENEEEEEWECHSVKITTPCR